MGSLLQPSTIGQALVWLSALIFGAGGIYARMDNTRADVDNLEEEVHHHTSMPSHPVGTERLEIMMVEQRALRADVTEQGRSLAAICQATDASCE